MQIVNRLVSSLPSYLPPPLEMEEDLNCSK